MSFSPIAIGGGVGCGGTTGQNAASHALKAPEMPTDKQSKCHVAKSQAEPLIVEWADTDRARLESLSHKGLVAVHYEGCTLRLLSRCTVKGAGYSYSPVTRRVNKLAIRDEDDLYMKMPFGAAQLEGKLKSAGQLNVQMTTVGRYEAPMRDVFKEDLEGSECKETTHVIHALTVGAFTFSAGADAEVGGGASIGGVGGGAKSAAARELLQKDGDETACEKASTSNTSPPEGCAGPFQIEVMPLARGSKPVAAAPAPVNPAPAPAPTSDPIPTPPPSPPPSSSSALTAKKPAVKCKKGFESIDGGPCVKVGAKKPASKPSVASSSTTVCGAGQHQVGARCVDDEPPIPPPPACGAGQHQVGTRCVDDEPPPPIVPPPPPSCVAGTHLENGACVVDPEPRITTYHPTYGASNPSDDQQQQSNPYRTLLWYGVYGFGLTALISGSIAVAAAKSANEQCDTDRGFCKPDYADKRSTAITAAVVADVALGLTVLSVLGIILLPSKRTRVGVAPTPGGVTGGVSGKF